MNFRIIIPRNAEKISGFKVFNVKITHPSVTLYIEEELCKNPVTGNFTKMNLEHIDFSQKQYLPAIFKNAMLRQCFLNGCKLQMTDIDHCFFSNCVLSDVTLAKTKYINVTFWDCQLTDADCHETTLVNCSFFNCDMRRIDLTGAQMTGCRFEKSNLAFSKLNNAKMQNCAMKTVTLGPLEYENLQADPQILKEILMANTVAEIFIKNGYQEAKENGVRIVTN